MYGGWAMAGSVVGLKWFLEKAEMISHSYDISDVKYIEAIVEYLSEIK